MRSANLISCCEATGAMDRVATYSLLLLYNTRISHNKLLQTPLPKDCASFVTNNVNRTNEYRNDPVAHEAPCIQEMTG